MKKAALLLLFFSTMIHAQHQDDFYTRLWVKVKQFESQDLPKSANSEVSKIYKMAKKENNSVQIIKSLLYQSKYTLTLEEDAQLKVIHRFEKEIAESQFPAKNILENVLANLYWQYFQQNRGRFYSRTKTDKKVDATDFRTWDLQTLFKEVHIHFQNSLQNALLAKNTPLSSIDELLITQENSQKYRPTLFDFLAHNALDFYKTDETHLTKPAYKFELTNKDLLAPASDFSRISLETKDSLSLQFHALQLFQELIRFHDQQQDIKALVVVDLERLQFVKQHVAFPDKAFLAFQTLQKSKDLYKDKPISTLYDYEIALYYEQSGKRYNSKKNPDVQWNLSKALAVCEKAIQRHPESLGAQKCQVLAANLKQSTLHLTLENYVPVATKSRMLVKYKNMDALDIKVLELSEKQWDQLNNLYKDSEKLAFISKLKTVKEWDEGLTNEHDYQLHTTELTLPELAQGTYLIFTKNKATDAQIFAFATFQVTDISLVESNIAKRRYYRVVNRNTGEPLQHAQVHISNIGVGRYSAKINKTLTTDANGQVSLLNNDYYSNVTVSVIYKDQKAVFGKYSLNKYYPYGSKPSDYYQAFIFTDRSIYRPGQTLYFKAIAVVRKPKGKRTFSEVLAQEKMQVQLRDVNGQEVGKLDLVSNEFGSVHGVFVLPDTGLTGAYSLHISGLKHQINAGMSISVEEYKRPKFETKFLPVSGSYKINDTVQVKGVATAFAGNAITDAKVVYKVHRKVQYPRWWYWYRPNFSSEPQEITHGITQTDKKGNYTIRFIAQPDLSVNKKDLPIFHYEIIADITDINGETHTAKTLVNVGYHSVQAQIICASDWNRKEKEQAIKIHTHNLNGQPVSVSGTLTIYKLQAPERVVRPRPWKAPDYKRFAKEEFHKLFPHEAYDDESDSRQWALGERVYQEAFTTKKTDDNTLLLKTKLYKKWLTGAYQIMLETQDKYGQPVTDKQIIHLYDRTENKVADNQLFTLSEDQISYRPGESICLQVGSASKDLWALISVEKENQIVQQFSVQLNDEIKYLEIPVKEKDLGGFAIHYQWVNYNAFDSGTLPINVPLEQKDLEIETLTFRDKLEPGSDQTWSFKLKGLQRDKIAAEFLASMYDASLDQFKPHRWRKPSDIELRIYFSRYYTDTGANFGIQSVLGTQRNSRYIPYPDAISFDRFNWFGLSLRGGRFYGEVMYDDEMIQPVMMSREIKPKHNKKMLANKATGMSVQEEAVADPVNAPKNKPELTEDSATSFDSSKVHIRTHFNETAFFYPQLHTDAKGAIHFTFTMPEALTKWKLQLLGHTTDFQTVYTNRYAVTQKELMVTPNVPRFLREGDTLLIRAKISNLTSKSQSGKAVLQLSDAITGKEIVELIEGDAQIPFTVAATDNTMVSWKINIPKNLQAVQYKIIAQSGHFSDGEQNILPVLTNRMLVTETLPMWVNGNSTCTFTLDKLKNVHSKSLTHHKLTLEVTSNPVWYAVQALPYLMEYPYECAEQTFSRYYANAIATHIVNRNPGIKKVFSQWKNTKTLLSNLEKNQELKSLLIAETPWLREAQSESEQKKRIALLFDLNKMTQELQKAQHKLIKMQMPNGGFPWFKGSRYPNRYITQYIVTGFAHLDKMGVDIHRDKATAKMLAKAVAYLDQELVDDYQKLLKEAQKIYDRADDKVKGEKAKNDYLASNHLGNIQLQYLYMRSFFPDKSMSLELKEAVAYYTRQSYKYWQSYALYQKGLIALVAHRNQNPAVASAVIKSLAENSITNDELGMYWKSNTSGWYWYQAPIETQALMIEAFSELGTSMQTIDNLKKWLLKNKQTNRWQTTKATSEAVYALLAYGTDWQNNSDLVQINIGGKTIHPMDFEDTKPEAGSGYFKISWNRGEITPEQATVTLSKKNKGVAWGALYWQYFEDLDKITWSKTPLQITKKLFLKKNTDTGEMLTEVNDKTAVKVGDLVRVRIELKVDRPMDFVHMKDMRASGLEPINVLSQYKYQDGLGYYESTKDAATHFFFDHLRKGVYVFEYDLRANNAGDFSDGITTIQCMYAPEFTSHSQGIRLKISQ